MDIASEHRRAQNETQGLAGRAAGSTLRVVGNGRWGNFYVALPRSEPPCGLKVGCEQHADRFYYAFARPLMAISSTIRFLRASFCQAGQEVSGKLFSVVAP